MFGPGGLEEISSESESQSSEQTDNIRFQLTSTTWRFILFEGGGPIICYGYVQAAAGRGGHVGDDQGAVSAHHFLHADVGAHCGGVWNPEETEPASRADRVQTLVRSQRTLGAAESVCCHVTGGAASAEQQVVVFVFSFNLPCCFPNRRVLIFVCLRCEMWKLSQKSV